MKRKRLLTLIGTLCLILALVAIPFTACAPEEPTPTPAEPIALSFNHLFPEVAWVHTEVVMKWKQMVEERTNGRVRITIYPSCALAKPGDMYDAVKAGTVDIALDPGPYYWGRFPMSEATQLPYLGAHSSWAASRAWMDLYEEFPELRKEYSDVHMLWLFSQGPGQIISREPIRTMADMKGLIVRGPGAQGDFVKALGSSPVSMPASDCYLALSKGTIDATTFPGEAIRTWKLYETCKYMTIGDFYVQWFFVVMNKDKYDSLPKDIQEVIDECSGVAGADLLGKAWNTADKAGFEFGKEQGMEAVYLTPEEAARWEQQCAPITEKWIADMEAKGYPAREFVDRAKQLIEKYNKEFGSWQD